MLHPTLDPGARPPVRWTVGGPGRALAGQGGGCVRRLHVSILKHPQQTLGRHSPTRKVLVQIGRADDVNDICAVNIHHANIIALVCE
jgi:hypothetical protein